MERTAREEIEYARGALASQRDVMDASLTEVHEYIAALNREADAALKRALEKLDKVEVG